MITCLAGALPQSGSMRKDRQNDDNRKLRGCRASMLLPQRFDTTKTRSGSGRLLFDHLIGAAKQ
jgi:hypothetical protein